MELQTVQMSLNQNSIDNAEFILANTEAENKSQAVLIALQMAKGIIKAYKEGKRIETIDKSGVVKDITFVGLLTDKTC
jgi:hypothetical protein